MAHKKVKPQGSEAVDSSWLLIIGVIGAFFILIGMLAAASDNEEQLFDPPVLEETPLSAEMEVFVLQESFLSSVVDETDSNLLVSACSQVQIIPNNEAEFFHVSASSGTYWIHIIVPEVAGSVGWIPLEALSLTPPEGCD